MDSSDKNKINDANSAQVMLSLGQLTGAVSEMYKGLSSQIEYIRTDIQRVEKAQSDRMDRIEASLGKRIDNVEANVGQRIDNVETNVGQRITDLSETINQRIDGLGGRVTNLEAEDKKIIEKVAKMSALGGGVGGALVTAVVELIKHTTK